jgi:hypothetical protein
MNVAVALLTLVLLAAVILVISAPLRRARRERSEPAERSELEAARLAKYREIRDLELDYRTGKLSHQDYERLVATLRAQAAEILVRLEALGGEVADVVDQTPARTGEKRARAGEKPAGAGAERPAPSAEGSGKVSSSPE